MRYEDGLAVWDALRSTGVMAFGVETYANSRRMEKSLRLQNADLLTEYNLIESDLQRPKVKEPDFRGKAANIRHRAMPHQVAMLCTLVMTNNIDSKGVARYPVGILPVMDPVTKETLVDDLGCQLRLELAPPRACRQRRECVQQVFGRLIELLGDLVRKPLDVGQELAELSLHVFECLLCIVDPLLQLALRGLQYFGQLFEDLGADQFDFEGLTGELVLGLALGDDAPLERLATLENRDHAFLDAAQILRMEGFGYPEVVIEPVFDGRADPQLRLGEQVLDRLRHHVRGRVAQDGETLRVVRSDRLDLVAVSHDVRQILEFTVDPGHKDAAVLSEQVSGCGALRYLAGFTGHDHVDGHGLSPS